MLTCEIGLIQNQQTRLGSFVTAYSKRFDASDEHGIISSTIQHDQADQHWRSFLRSVRLKKRPSVKASVPRGRQQRAADVNATYESPKHGISANRPVNPGSKAFSNAKHIIQQQAQAYNFSSCWLTGTADI
jgi:hypothetical protein